MVHKCSKIGCSAEFKWPVQLHRHKKKCRHPERQKLILYTKDGNMFVCEKCKKKFSQQSNAAWHVKTCKGVKEIVLLKCKKCPLEFKYKILLKKHMITHERKDYQCSGCFRNLVVIIISRIIFHFIAALLMKLFVRVLLIITLVELKDLLFRPLLIRMNHIIVLPTFMRVIQLKILQH